MNLRSLAVALLLLATTGSGAFAQSATPAPLAAATPTPSQIATALSGLFRAITPSEVNGHRLFVDTQTEVKFDGCAFTISYTRTASDVGTHDVWDTQTHNWSGSLGDIDPISIVVEPSITTYYLRMALAKNAPAFTYSGATQANRDWHTQIELLLGHDPTPLLPALRALALACPTTIRHFVPDIRVIQP